MFLYIAQPLTWVWVVIPTLLIEDSSQLHKTEKYTGLFVIALRDFIV